MVHEHYFKEMRMVENPFAQNVIAIIWDFDMTLASSYMQKPIFKKFNVDEKKFWEENNCLIKQYEKRKIKVNPDTVYLNHLLTCVEQGIFPGLNNDMLRELGKEIEFFEGIPEFLKKVKDLIEKDEKFKKYHITLEHYIISTRLAEMIRGSKVAEYVDGIWGCEFIEEPIHSELKPEKSKNYNKSNTKEIKQIAYAIDNTSKTRAIFEINKGVNKHKDLDVNAKMPFDARRIPFENMIYIGDGPSDIPVFSLLKQNGGKTFAVYPKHSVDHFQQVDKLRKDDRIDMYGEADYREGTLTYMWITEHAKQIANRIYNEKETAIEEIISSAPEHIV